MHTALVSGWASTMLLYELIILDPSDPVYNPIWRQGCYLIPFTSRLGVVRSLYDWSLGIEVLNNVYWSYESVSSAHIILSGALILASFWHWAYWDLDVFQSQTSGKLLLDLNRIFGIHLSLASILCFGFGIGHLTGFLGPGMWTSDSFGLVGSPRFVKPIYSILSLAPFSYGAIPSHHILAGFAGLCVGFWHISSRPGPTLYSILKMGNIEGVLSSSIAAVFFTAALVQAGMWYSGVSTPIELFGPSRYHWDNAYFALDIERRVKSLDSVFLNKAWGQVPDKLMLYDFIGSNPSKGGLFRSGPMLKGPGIVQNWLGHASYEMGTLSLAVRRMPAFFEGFPVVLIDAGGTLRADIPFRRASSSLSIEQTGVVLFFLGGILSGTEYSRPSLVKNYARKALNGEIFTFDRRSRSNEASLPDGLSRTSPRGWYSFSHASLSALFFFGHLWHAARALFRDLWTGVSMSTVDEVEYGRNEKLGDGSSKTSAFL
jgi:photosystem II CP47 chlorophyll apoprotein